MIVAQALAQLWGLVFKMETQTKVNAGLISTILIMIASFTTYVVLDDEGIELEPTHYCESRNATMYCARTTAQYCRPSMTTTIGSKRCIEGWKLIPEIEEIPEEPAQVYEITSKSSGSGKSHCTYKACF